ncbi:hypothetical protein ACSEOJ_27245 [Pseudomonas aeruginosa]
MLDLDDSHKVEEIDDLYSIRIAYQTPVTIRLPKSGAEAEALPNTFEDSLVLSNVQRFTGKPRRGLMRAFSEAIQNADTVQALGVALFEKLRTGDKAEFALEVLGDPDFGQLVVPAYIHEGLTWLQSKLELKRKDLLVVPPAIVEVTEE